VSLLASTGDILDLGHGLSAVVGAYSRATAAASSTLSLLADQPLRDRVHLIEPVDAEWCHVEDITPGYTKIFTVDNASPGHPNAAMQSGRTELLRRRRAT